MIIIKDRAHMSIGRSFSIKRYTPEHGWHSGKAYNYGMMPPRYPVPAPIFRVEYGGITWKWLRIVNYTTNRIRRYWDSEGVIG